MDKEDNNEKCNRMWQNEEIAQIKRDAIGELRMHFVYNTLNALRYQIRQNPDVAYDMVYDLAKYLQGSCEDVFTPGPTLLKSELEHARAYAALVENQDDRFELVWELGRNEEGYVIRGSIYRKVIDLVKQALHCGRGPFTLIVKREEEPPRISLEIPQQELQSSIRIETRGEVLYEDHTCG